MHNTLAELEKLTNEQFIARCRGDETANTRECTWLDLALKRLEATDRLLQAERYEHARTLEALAKLAQSRCQRMERPSGVT